jgi:hypothetical protein
MRFSLKWILASQRTWVYADILFVATLALATVAFLHACFARGRSQVAAAGFLFMSGVYFLYVMSCDPNLTPAWRLLNAAGVGASAIVSPDGKVLGFDPSVRWTVSVPDFNALLRATNMVFAIMLGLLGSALSWTVARVANKT